MADQEHLKILKSGVSKWNTWRNNEKIATPDLSAVNLSGESLRHVKLVGVNLSGAVLYRTDLRDAELTMADMRGANLQDANMRGANLTLANLSRSDLSMADMRQTMLSDAWFCGTTFRKTIMRGAQLLETTFAMTSLKSIVGLDECHHIGPSSIDYFTLMNSGPLPEIFLRGCGLQDEFIKYLPSFWNHPLQFYSCFISYSHADKSFARRLHDALQGRGIRCWLDEHQILPGDKIHRAIDEGVRLWDKVLLCCSEKSLTSWWVDKEVEKAVMKEEKLSKERGKEVLSIIPLNLDGFMFAKEWTDWKQQHLTSRQAPDFSGWDKDNAKFERELEKVIKALRADANAREIPPKSLL